MKNNNEVSIDNSKPFPREREIAINARLLYLYVGHPDLPYESWVVSLRSMVAQRGRVPRFRLMVADEGDLALNVDFAVHFVQRINPVLIYGIALILIDEGCNAASEGDFDYVNQLLDRYSPLAMAGGWMHAETLHAFLEVTQPFETWLSLLKKGEGMSYGPDYHRVTFDNGGGGRVLPGDDGKGEVMFEPRFAMKVAAAEPTRRGELVRSLLPPGDLDLKTQKDE